MISSIQTALKNAIDVLAPPATPLQDFTYHWKQLMNFYVNHSIDYKVSVQNTGIPRHLDRLLEILLEEERENDEPGSCLEYLLRHKLLDLLATLASAESPPGMRPICLSFLRKFLARSKHPLLHHASIYNPVQRLIALCNGSQPSAIENEEVQFLLTLCFLVCKYPHVTNIINDVSTTTSCERFGGNLDKIPKREGNCKVDRREEIQRVTYVSTRKRNNSNPLFEPLDAQAVTLMKPNLFVTDNAERVRRSVSSTDASTTRNDGILGISGLRSNASDVFSSRDGDEEDVEQPESDSQPSSSPSSIPRRRSSVSEARRDYDREDIPCEEDHDGETKERGSHDKTLISDSETSLGISNDHSECLLLNALTSYLNSADNTVRVRACEGIMVLASLGDTPFARTIARSELPSVISNRLEVLFNAIPAHVDPNEIEAVDATWGLDSPLWTKEKRFSGCRQVGGFLAWFDYCDQLTREAHPELGRILAKTIRSNFFERILTAALADHHVVLVTALLTKCLKEITSSALCAETARWLVGQDGDSTRDPRDGAWSSHTILHRLVDNCSTDSDDLTLETLKLFEEMVDKRNEQVLHSLLLTYLSSRGYYDNSAADSAIASWSDEEDEREREKKGSLDLSYEQSHSRTLAPSNIHRIVNCFLSLVPRYLQTDSDVNNYERYMADWERQYSTVLVDCSSMAWPLEAISLDDTASSDSRPEADHCATRFYAGPFLTMLLDKVSNIPRQRYEINLQLTVLISRLALLPHPYLHEFLLNPLLPLAPGTKSLFVSLQKVVKQLINEIPKSSDRKELLKETRNRLLEDSISHEGNEKENILFESVVITEEFCKELAAIAYVKYHHSV